MLHSHPGNGRAPVMSEGGGTNGRCISALRLRFAFLVQLDATTTSRALPDLISILTAN